MEEVIGLEVNDRKGHFYISANGKQEGIMTFVFHLPKAIRLSLTTPK